MKAMRMKLHPATDSMVIMNNFSTLDIILYDKVIGNLTRFANDRNLLTFNQEYIENSNRSTLSLSFQDTFNRLITNFKTTQTKLPPFFSNLLPEGHMRTYLANQVNVNPIREFYLLAALGEDLPGALKVIPSEIHAGHNNEMEEILDLDKNEYSLRFSLAGIQLKFSAIWEAEKGLTIPSHGVGGSWIIKLPSSTYQGVPENEYFMLEMARKLGMDVPETALVPLEQIQGLPKGIEKLSNNAFITKRFDRLPNGKSVHMEDFAQVFNVYPEEKYRTASYRNIAEVIWSEMGEQGLIEFIKRFVFNALIGNGDMHLKNWSLVYPDKKKAILAPAYDFVSTIPYIPGDNLALSFVDSKAFHSLTVDQFKRFAAKSNIPESLVIETAVDMVKKFKILWNTPQDLFLNEDVRSSINAHLKTIPIYN